MPCVLLFSSLMALLLSCFSIQGSVHFDIFSLSILSFAYSYTLLDAAVPECPGHHIANNTTTTFAPVSRRETCSSVLFFIYLCTNVHRCFYAFALQQAMKDICLAMQHVIESREGNLIWLFISRLQKSSISFML